MKFKLDENFDRRLSPLFEAEGHDVDSVTEEGLSGSNDEAIYDACRAVDRALITLDLDFSNPFASLRRILRGSLLSARRARHSLQFDRLSKLSCRTLRHSPSKASFGS